MKAIEYKKGNDVVKNVPRVLSLDSVVNIDDTILSEQFQKEGCVITFEQEITGLTGSIKKLKIPPCPHSVTDNMIVLDDVALKLNNLLRVMDLIKEGKKEHKHLAKSVRALQMLVIDKITQKQGLLMREVIGSRMAFTARAVLTPSCTLPPSYVRLPHLVGSKLKLKNGDLVIVGRDPTIWHGSIEVLEASMWRHKTVGLNPIVYNQLGADNDGDTVWVLKVPETEACQEAARKQILGFARARVKEISRANTGELPAPFDWEKDSVEHFYRQTTGFSISPLDIIEGSAHTSDFEAATGKKVQAEALKILDGVEDKEFKKWLITVNHALLVQKKYLGPAGAASNKLKLVGTVHPSLLLPANVISERLQQVLFDFKGTVNSNNNSVDIFDFIDLVTLQRAYRSTPETQVGHTQALKRLAEYGLDLKVVAPIIVYIYSIHHAIEAMMKFKTMSQLKENGTFEKLIGLCNYEVAQDEVAFRTQLKEICKENKMDFRVIFFRIAESRMRATLGNILGDPIYNLTNQTTAITEDTISQLKELKTLLGGQQNNNLLTSTLVMKAAKHV